MRQKSAVEKTTSDYERYEKNRRRRLLKEKSRKASPSAPPPESRTPVPRAVASSSHEKILKCGECHQEIHPPYQIYVCQNNHLHTERVGGNQPNIKVSLDLIIFNQLFIINVTLVLLDLFWTLSVQNEIFQGGNKRKINRKESLLEIYYKCI